MGGDILSYEGYGRDLSPKKITTGLPIPYNYNGPTVLDPGARITMAVTAPKTPGTYYLADDMLMQLRPAPQGFFALATIHVEGAPAAVPPPNLTATGPAPEDLPGEAGSLPDVFVGKRRLRGRRSRSRSTGAFSR